MTTVTCCTWGCPGRQTRKLQPVQNAMAHMLTGVTQSQQVTPMVFPSSIQVLVITYKALYSLQPRYQTDRLTLQMAARPP